MIFLERVGGGGSAYSCLGSCLSTSLFLLLDVLRRGSGGDKGGVGLTAGSLFDFLVLEVKEVRPWIWPGAVAVKAAGGRAKVQSDVEVLLDVRARISVEGAGVGRPDAMMKGWASRTRVSVERGV